MSLNTNTHHPLSPTSGGGSGAGRPPLVHSQSEINPGAIPPVGDGINSGTGGGGVLAPGVTSSTPKRGRGGGMVDPRKKWNEGADEQEEDGRGKTGGLLESLSIHLYGRKIIFHLGLIFFLGKESA